MINTLIGKIYSKFEGNNRIERIWKLANVDFKKRYYNTRLGVLWIILNPLFQIMIYYNVFKYIRISQEPNFVFFLYLGLISFAAFNMLAIKGLNLIKSKKYLFANIQFNKFDLFWSMGLSILLSYLVDLTIYSIGAYFYNAIFNVNSFWIIGIIIQILMLGISLSILLAVIKIRVQDITNLWRVINFTLFWTSGVIYSGESIIKAIPESVYVNPLLGILVNVRLIFLYGQEINLNYFFINSVQIFIVFIVSIYLLNKNWHLALEKL